jgi:hypothetical protein
MEPRGALEDVFFVVPADDFHIDAVDAQKVAGLVFVDEDVDRKGQPGEDRVAVEIIEVVAVSAREYE